MLKVFTVHGRGWSCDLSVLSISRWNILMNWTSVNLCGKMTRKFLFQLQKSKEREERLEEVIQAYEKIHLEKSNVQRDLDKMVSVYFYLTILGRSKVSVHFTIFLCLLRQLWRSSIWSRSAVWSQRWGRGRPPSRNWALSSAAKTRINPSYMPVWMYPEVGSVWIKITEDWKHGSNIKPASSRKR